MGYVGRVSTPKSRNVTPNDLIMTKPETAKFIIDYFKPTGKILEPCRGTGSFYDQFEGDKDWCEIKKGKDLMLDVNQLVYLFFGLAPLYGWFILASPEKPIIYAAHFTFPVFH